MQHNPFKALVAPRPIGWISSLNKDGHVNLAPYSFFNGVADEPPMVMYSSTGAKTEIDEGKDTLANLRETGEFVVNIVPNRLRDAMNVTSAHFPSNEDEFERAGLEKAECRIVEPPRVAAAPAALECLVWKVIDLPGASNHMVIGEVVGVHIDDEVIVGGNVDVTVYQPLCRLGYRDYATVSEVFSLRRPDDS